MVTAKPIAIKIDWYVVYKLKGQEFSLNPTVYVYDKKSDNSYEKGGRGGKGEKEQEQRKKLLKR